ncbi:MAG: ABC transporter permease [Gorillibacterium sp.]|nr:ABC transporter permease [Gorillibacterium sp.]
MRNVCKLVIHEIKDVLKNPAVIILVLLPIFMSIVMVSVIDIEGMEMMLLSTWVLFAQVMIGIMLTGPNLIEEREGNTFDALLLSPLRFGDIVGAKGLTSLIFSLFAQLVVLIANHGFSSEIIPALFFMVLGGVIFVEVGLLIGLIVNSSKNGAAISAALMVIFFLVTAVYQAMPDWTYWLFAIIPSIEVVVNLNSVLAGNGFPLVETAMLGGWLAVFTLWLVWIGKKR